MNTVTFFSFFFEAIIIGIFARMVFKPRLQLWLRQILYAVMFGSIFLIHSPNQIARNVCLDIIVMILIFHCIYDGKFGYSIYCALLLEAINFITEILVGSIASHFFITFWAEAIQATYYFIFLFAKILFFLLALVLSFFLNQTNHQISKVGLIEFTIAGILVCSLGFLYILSEIAFIVPHSVTVEKLIFGALFILIIFLVLSFLLFQANEKKNQNAFHMQLQLQKNLDNELYFKSIEQKDKGLNILVHDMKNHLQTLAALNEQGEKDKVTEYIENLLKKSNLKAAIDISTNKLLNSIIYRYYIDAMSKNLKFSYDIRTVDIDFIEEIDLTSVLCNLLDNAFEGCRNENPFVDISIYPGNEANSLVITVINNCGSKPVINRSGQFLSLKKNGLHGYGIESIKQIVKKYEGEVNIYYQEEDNTFHAVVLMKNKNENCNMRR